MGHGHGQGGAQTAFRELVEVCVREGYRVRAVVLKDRERFDSRAVEEACLGIVPLTANTLGGRLAKFCRMVAIRRRARAWRPAVAVAVGLNHSTRFVASGLHRGCFRVAQDFIHGRAADDPVLAATAKVFEGLAVQSPSMVLSLKKAGFSTCPVDWLPCFPKPPEEGVLRLKPCPHENVRLGYFGRLAGNKGLPMLIKAVASSTFPRQTRLDIWGEGAEGPGLQSLIQEMAIADTISLRGAYPSGRAGAGLMAGYDGIVLTSSGSEGLPLVLLEALSYGVPILATDVGAVRDCCSNNPDAILVAPDYDSVCCGLDSFVHGILFDRFDPGRARRFYEQHFSYPVMVARWRAFLDSPHAFFGRS